MYFKIFLLTLVVFTGLTLSQENKDIITVNTNSPKKWDTTCYISYSDKLNIYIIESRLDYNINITSSFKHSYKYPVNLSYKTFTPINFSVGFSYDKISFSFGVARKYDNDTIASRPKSKYNSYFFSFGGNKFIVEPYLVKYKGFYEQNTPKYDSTFSRHGRYYSDPSMQISSFKVNFIYFFNNLRFAYRSISGFTYRQIASRGSWMFLANAYYIRFGSDNIIYPAQVMDAYDSVKKLNSFEIYGISAGPGYGYIWTPGKKKRFFIGITLGIMPGFQKKRIFFKDSLSHTRNSIGFSNDVRFSMGWTTNKFFLVIFGASDRVNLNYSRIKFSTLTTPVNLMLGFRFNVKPPRFYRWLMNTRFYGWI